MKEEDINMPDKNSILDICFWIKNNAILFQDVTKLNESNEQHITNKLQRDLGLNLEYAKEICYTLILFAAKMELKTLLSKGK